MFVNLEIEKWNPQWQHASQRSVELILKACTARHELHTPVQGRYVSHHETTRKAAKHLGVGGSSGSQSPFSDAPKIGTFQVLL